MYVPDVVIRPNYRERIVIKGSREIPGYCHTLRIYMS